MVHAENAEKADIEGNLGRLDQAHGHIAAQLLVWDQLVERHLG